MIALAKRVKKLEQLQRTKGGVFTAFQWGQKMKIVGGNISYRGPAVEGEKLLAGLPEGALLVRFNIPRPETLETETVLWET